MESQKLEIINKELNFKEEYVTKVITAKTFCYLNTLYFSTNLDDELLKKEIDILYNNKYKENDNNVDELILLINASLKKLIDNNEVQIKNQNEIQKKFIEINKGIII